MHKSDSFLWHVKPLFLLILATSGNADAVPTTNVDCDRGGTCPSLLDRTPNENNACGLWLGPSLIKDHENHGFGLGIFTGRDIPKGTVMDAELLVPFFDYDDDHHPPLREYFWTGGELEDIVLECFESLVVFMPGLAAIAPCTDKNYSLKKVHDVSNYNAGVHRSRDANAGSFSYRQDQMFTAVRDITAGEELTVECDDDEFDGEAYSSKRYNSNDNAIMCLDDAVRVDTSTIPKIGKGLIAKRALKKGEVILSTPVLAIHADEMVMRATSKVRNKIKQQQLLLNYCYSHPDSELFLLPFGPTFNYINHSPKAGNTDEKNSANTHIQWHTSTFDSEELSRRQEHHHPELFDMTAKQVSEKHGKGLVIDLIASRDISEGEELFLEYGDEWKRKWKTHVDQWQQKSSELYMSALDYSHFHNSEEPIRTVTQQHRKPYPTNLQTACYFNSDWIKSEVDEEGITYKSWDAHDDHDCLLPCIILEKEVWHDDDDVVASTDPLVKMVYTAKLVDVAHQENTDIDWECHLEPNYEYIYTDIPRKGILIVDQPYSTDMFLEDAFRQPIGVPSGFYPDAWLKKRIRRRGDSSKDNADNDGDEFKRKDIRKPEQQIKVKV